jgi:RHS repeat-associated protein
MDGSVCQTAATLPFGDAAQTSGACSPSLRLFTGKERDTESGNDYFGARYYASTLGRWLSPDWSAKVEPVPYAKMDTPQSLNLYSYVANNPVTGFDPDGHICAPELVNNRTDYSGPFWSEGGGLDLWSTEYPLTSWERALLLMETVRVAQQQASVKQMTYQAVNGGVEIELAATVKNASSYKSINWTQDVTLTNPGEKPVTYRDGGGLYNTPSRMAKQWYKDDLASQKADSIFYDSPARLPDTAGNITWHANLNLVGVNQDGSLTTLKSISYGFSLSPSGTVTLEQLKGIP